MTGWKEILSVTLALLALNQVTQGERQSWITQEPPPGFGGRTPMRFMAALVRWRKPTGRRSLLSLMTMVAIDSPKCKPAPRHPEQYGIPGSQLHLGRMKHSI